MRCLIAIAAACVCIPVDAAQLTVTPYPNNVYAIFLDGESTVFNGVALSAKPNGGEQFRNTSSGGGFGIRPPGGMFTYTNRLLDLDPTDPDNPGGKGWTLIGRTATTAEVGFAGGPLGQTISTASEPNGDLFLANLMLHSSTSTATVQLTLVNGIDTVFEQTMIVGVPEPATLALAGVGAIALAAVRRLRAA